MLDKNTVKILKFINKNPDVTLEELKEHFGNECNDSVMYLYKNSYIANKSKGYHPLTHSQIYANEYRILPHGKSYLQNTPKEAFLKIYPQIISTAALIVSIIALLKSFGIIFPT